MNETFSEAIVHIEKLTYTLLITLGDDHKPSAREVGPFINDGLDIYFFTRIDTQKVRHINNNPSVTLYFPNTNPVLNQFISVIISGKASRVSEETEFNHIVAKLDLKSPGYKQYICNQGFDIWTVYKVTAEDLQFTDYSKKGRTTKITL